MAKFIQAELERCVHNSDGSAVTLYFMGVPNDKEIQMALVANPNLCACGESLESGGTYQEHPSPLSELAGAKRYQVYPG